MRRFAVVLLCATSIACHRNAEPEAPEPTVRASTPEPAETIAAPRLSVQLLDHAGQPLAAGRVEIRRPNHRKALLEQELDDGQIELELSGPGAYLVEVAGVDHAHEYIHLLVGDGPIELTARLGTYAREAVGDSVALRARWIGEDGQPGESFAAEAVRASADADHRLRLEAPAGAKALQYQLSGLSGGRTYNGPGGQRWVYDGGGDYWAEVAIDAPKVELELDLDALPPAGLRSTVELHGATRYQGVATNLVLNPYWDRIRALFDEHKDVEDEEKGKRLVGEGMAVIAAEARATVEAIDDPQLRKVAALEWLAMFAQFAREGTLEVESLTWVFERVPADDPSWSFGRLSSMFYELDAAPIQAQLAALAEHQRDPGVLADLLYIELILADKRDDQAAVRELYSRLSTNYPDTYSAFYAASSYDPDRPLQPGKRMPEWSFPSLDGSSQVSSADFAGRAYLLDIWASWCGPCVGEMASLHEAHAAMSGGDATQTVAFVGLSMDASAADVAKLREQWPMPWTHALVPAGEQQALHDRWSFAGVPTVVLVDADGMIVAVNEPLRGEKLLPTLRAFTGRSRPTARASTPRPSR